MSAERKPQENPAFVERPLLALTRLVLRFPLATLLVGIALAAGATLWSNARLGFRTSRSDLLNPKSQFNKLWLEYTSEFGDEQDVVAVVEGADRAAVLAARDDLATAVRREKKLFESVLAGVDPAPLRAKGLYYLPPELLAEVERFVRQADGVVRDGWSSLSLGAMAQNVAQELQRAGAQRRELTPAELASLTRFLDAVQAALDGRYQSPFPPMALPVANPQDAAGAEMLSRDGRMGFVLLKLVKDDNSTDFVQGDKGIQRLRALVAEVKMQHPDTQIGLTGIPIIEHDEMLSSKVSMAQVSLVSLLGVSILFMAGFGGWRHPLLAVASLTLGTAWSMGYITAVIGHLNILSSAFGVILIGQGIDFSMYYVAQYLQLRKTMGDCREALVRTVQTVGPGVATGAVTTAVAFFMAGLTEFTGVAELGIIAGGGILLCWIAGLTLLPAMIYLVDSRWPSKHTPVPVDVRSWLEPLLARPRLVLAVTSAATVFLAVAMNQLWYDHNLLNLQANGLESVELEKRLLNDADQNTSYAVSIADTREKLLENRQKFLRLDSVKCVEEIASRLPDDVEAKQAGVRRIHDLLADLPERAPRIPASDPRELGQLAALLENVPAGATSGELQLKMRRLTERLQSLDPRTGFARLGEFQQQMAEELLDRLRAVQAVSGPEPPQFSDLPEGLVSRFVSEPNHRFLLRVYSKKNIWDMDGMKRFVADVRSVDERATGNPMQVYEASLQMKQSYEEAALYALAIILPVLFLDFLTIRHTLLALLPLGLGMVQMFGLMAVLNVPLNPANMIVLPLILGIGIDAGVHIVHDYCSQTGRYRVNASTASAVVINTVTNMAGFGSLMIASHRGLQGLGRVLTLGLVCCLFTSLVMLPAILTLLSRRRPALGENDLGLESDAGPPMQRIYRLDRPKAASARRRPLPVDDEAEDIEVDLPQTR
jgi:hopanoid biosynthesis associated RND transporter like protein HpnN